MRAPQVFTVGGGTLDISYTQLELVPETVGILPRHWAWILVYPWLLVYPWHTLFATGHMFGLSMPAHGFSGGMNR